MNTITIDQNLYNSAVSYVHAHKMSLQTLVETYLSQLLREVGQKEPVKEASDDVPILRFEELQPELQEILELSAPLKGTVPEWDLNGDIARDEALKADLK